uniref:EGF-like domain-containing protein n=1 Tax=Amazona collaria TaxID=241587 RepID=A0A8B9GKN0_9PSIT
MLLLGRVPPHCGRVVVAPSDGDVLVSPQECLSQQQALSVVQQMQRLLAAQEAAQLHGTRSLHSTLAMSTLTRVCLSAETCPQPVVPLNGRVLGQSVRVGHDIHFVCDAGFRLVGSETHTLEQSQGAMGLAMPGGSSSHGVPLFCSPGCREMVTPISTADWLTLSNASFSRQPHCAEGQPGSRRCSCDLGFQMRDSGMCHDVDECQLFQSIPQTRLCLHECLNLPGSYLCLCPPGYLLHSDRNACEDVNECTRKQHNCTQGDICINTFGGHRCVRPKCPPPCHNTSYVKTSAFQCDRNPCPMENQACRLAPTSISFHYLPLRANHTVPHVLFKMSTTRFMGDSLRFAITGCQGQGVFAVRRSGRQAGDLVITSPVVGAATLEVELEMSKLSRKALLGKHVFKVTAFVSPYEF